MEVQSVASDTKIKLEDSWKKELVQEFTKPYMTKLREFLAAELSKGKIIYPKASEYFAAFKWTPFDKVKVVILGQDPYHGPNQAHGLCFSVKPGVAKPPSLVNIFKELKSDLGVEPPPHGCLIDWAREGVLLLNSVLSVEASQAASHAGMGWEIFTDRVIEVLNQREEPMVFILWGSYAQKKGAIVDHKKHLVLKCVHPSPLSVHRGFYGSKPFSQANEFLVSKGIAPIDWEIADEPNYEF